MWIIAQLICVCSTDDMPETTKWHGEGLKSTDLKAITGPSEVLVRAAIWTKGIWAAEWRKTSRSPTPPMGFCQVLSCVCLTWSRHKLNLIKVSNAFFKPHLQYILLGFYQKDQQKEAHCEMYIYCLTFRKVTLKIQCNQKSPEAKIQVGESNKNTIRLSNSSLYGRMVTKHQGEKNP